MKLKIQETENNLIEIESAVKKEIEDLLETTIEPSSGH